MISIVAFRKEFQNMPLCRMNGKAYNPNLVCMPKGITKNQIILMDSKVAMLF
jgi:hypothetical protein